MLSAETLIAISLLLLAALGLLGLFLAGSNSRSASHDDRPPRS
jgi:hypothetical protein